MNAPFTPPNGSEESEGAAPPTAPCSPFRPDGICRVCGGHAEHFRTCPHATWERRELA